MLFMILNFEDTKRLIESYNIKFCKTEFAKDKKGIIHAAKKIGFPVVLKIVSQKIVHKTDFGGVKLNLKNENELIEAYNEILKSISKRLIDGFLVQKMLEGVELIIGAKQDEQFGPIVLFGAGGIFVELIKDFSIRIAPINKNEAMKMIKEIKSYPILRGARKGIYVDIEKLAKIISSVSKLICENEIRELDLNPIIANGENIVVVDARVIV